MLARSAAGFIVMLACRTCCCLAICTVASGFLAPVAGYCVRTLHLHLVVACVALGTRPQSVRFACGTCCYNAIFAFADFWFAPGFAIPNVKPIAVMAGVALVQSICLAAWSDDSFPIGTGALVVDACIRVFCSCHLARIEVVIIVLAFVFLTNLC